MQKIVDRFHRNTAKPATEDVAELVLLIAEDRIQLTFHHQDDKITAATRDYDFLKPANANDKGAILQYSPDMTSTFQVIDHTIIQIIIIIGAIWGIAPQNGTLQADWMLARCLDAGQVPGCWHTQSVPLYSSSTALVSHGGNSNRGWEHLEVALAHSGGLTQ